MPKLIYLVTEDWYFLSHRLPMARAARAAGYEVLVATRIGDGRAKIEAEGFRVCPFAWERRSAGLFSNLKALAEIYKLYKREKPDVVHHVALKPVVLGAPAAWAAGVRGVVNALTGLGFLFISNTPKARILRVPVVAVLRFFVNRKGSVLVFQNADDRDKLVAMGLARRERTVIIRGSGIDVAHYQPLPEPEGPVTVGFVGRMLEDKGVRPLVEAVQMLRAEGLDVRLLLAGTPDPENRATISDVQMKAWAALPGIEWLGAVKDVREVWGKAHIAALPSRREGLPKSLLEAAACGRALVATNVPGCREIAHEGENGFLVPVDDAPALAFAIEKLALDADLRRRFGAASRRMVESDLSAEAVGKATVELYNKLAETPEIRE